MIEPMPTPQPFQPFQSRAARVREEARERARRYREAQQQTREIDEALLAEMLFLLKARVRSSDGHFVTGKGSVEFRDVIGHAAYRLAGGKEGYGEQQLRILTRLEALLPTQAPAHA